MNDFYSGWPGMKINSTVEVYSLKLKFSWETFGISLILMLSVVLNFVNLSIEGYANTYYSAGVKSMMISFKNFFFLSFDPSGFISIDKPPIGFWLQTISAKIFGFSGWSVIFPQALAGVISVGIIYHLVKRAFGGLAGLVAAFCLAITPIFVAASRNNTIDNLLVLSLLLACWPLFIAAEKGKFKYHILSLVLVGIGFNIKMAEAYMVAPAIYITYLLSSALPFKNKIKHLILGSVVLVVVSLSWAIIVDLVPPGDRPYVGSSTNNTVTQLVTGHNGLERVGIVGMDANMGQQQSGDSKSRTITAQRPLQIEQRISSIAKLFTYNNLSDQISWFLSFAIIGFLAAAIEEKLKFPFDNKKKLSLLLWSMWLLPEFIYFSFSNIVTHPYYLTTMAPSIAALSGIGLAAMWKFYKEDGWKKWFLPMAFIINGLIEISILSDNYKASNGYKITLIVTGILCLGTSIILILAVIGRRGQNALYQKILVSIAFIGISIAPIVWSFTTLFYPMDGNSPSAGLELVSARQNMNINVSNNLKLIQFLEKNKKNERYLVVVPSALVYASDLILKVGEPVMTLGGFSGADEVLTLNQFKQLVGNSAIRYAFVSDNSPLGGNRIGRNSEIMNWIKTNGKLVPINEWENSVTINKPTHNQRFGVFLFGSGISNQLYDLKTNTDISTK